MPVELVGRSRRAGPDRVPGLNGALLDALADLLRGRPDVLTSGFELVACASGSCVSIRLSQGRPRDCENENRNENPSFDVVHRDPVLFRLEPVREIVHHFNAAGPRINCRRKSEYTH